jgi:hypothetical protein
VLCVAAGCTAAVGRSARCPAAAAARTCRALACARAAPGTPAGAPPAGLRGGTRHSAHSSCVGAQQCQQQRHWQPAVARTPHTSQHLPLRAHTRPGGAAEGVRRPLAAAVQCAHARARTRAHTHTHTHTHTCHGLHREVHGAWLACARLEVLAAWPLWLPGCLHTRAAEHAL